MKSYTPHVAVIAAYSLLIASTAAAQEPRQLHALQEVPEVPAIPPGADRIGTVTEGARVPFTGMVLDTDTAIRWTNALQWWPEVFRLRASFFAAVVEETVASYERRLTILGESHERVVEGYREDIRDLAQQLANALQRQWYDTVLFGYVLGTLIALLIGGVSIGVAIGVR